MIPESNDTAQTFNPQVSLIDSAAHREGLTQNAPAGEAVNYLDVLRDISAGEHAEMVKRIREAQAKADEATAQRLKARLPGYLTSGVFPIGWRPRGESKRTYRTDKDCQTHANVVAFDSDKFADADEMEREIERVQSLPEVYYVARSVSGKGYHTGIRIAVPESVDLRDSDNHKAAWHYASDWLDREAERNKANHDKTSKNLARFHYTSSDPQAYINERPAQLAIPESAFQTAKANKGGGKPLKEETLKLILEAAEHLPLYEGAGEASQYEGVLFGLAQCDRLLGNGANADDYPLALAYAARHKPSGRNADARRADRAPETDNPGRTVNILLKLARDNGWKDPRKGDRVGRVGYGFRTAHNLIEWILRGNSGEIIGAYDYHPPQAAGDKSMGAFYQKRDNGLLGRTAVDMGAIVSRAWKAYIAAAIAADFENPKEFGAVSTHSQKLLSIDAGRDLAQGLANVVGDLQTRGLDSPTEIVDLAQIDSDREWLGVKNGAVNLRTGELVDNAHELGVYISQSVPVNYNPDAESPWLNMLLDHPTSAESVDFALDCFARAFYRKPRVDKRIVVMVDEGEEDAGDSGKSLLWDAFAGTLGNQYAAILAKDAVEKSKTNSPGRANPELKPLVSAIAVFLREFQGVPVSEDSVKALTGDIDLTLRDLYETFVQRRVTATMFAASNGIPLLQLYSKPVLERYVPIPFTRIPADKQVKRLAEIWSELSDEGEQAREAFLANLIRRAGKFADEPPPLPDFVLETKKRHHGIKIGEWGHFVEARVEVGEAGEVLVSNDLWEAWLSWNDEAVTSTKDSVGGVNKTEASKRISKKFPAAPRGRKKIGGKPYRTWIGLRLREESDLDPDDGEKQRSETVNDGAKDVPPKQSEWQPCENACGRKTLGGVSCKICEMDGAPKPTPTARPTSVHAATLDIGEQAKSPLVYGLPPTVIAGDRIALDLETTGLSPITDSIVAVLAHRDGTTYIARPDKEAAAWVKDALGTDGAEIVTQNGHAFDVPFIHRWLGTGAADVKARLVDTTVLASVASPGERTGLGELIKDWLGETVKKDRTLTNAGFVWPADAARMTREQEVYCDDDVRFLIPLADALNADIDRKGRAVWARLETAIQPSITALHLALLPVDADGVSIALANAERERDDLLAGLQADGLEKPNAPAQVKEWLAKQGADVLNTQEATLSDVPEAARILAYRGADKRAKTLAAIQRANESEGGFRGSYRQNGTSTARFSGRGVDLGAGKQQPQNIARDLRGLFTTQDGWLVTADLAGVELRIHAARNDSEMAAAFRDGRDLHDETQTRGNLESRTKAKNCNFCLVFGGGRAGAAKAGIDLSHADIHAWRGAWKESAQTIDDARERVEAGEPIEVPGAFGYKRTLEDSSLTASNLLNTPVQTTAALGLKAALVELQLTGQTDRLLMVLHDEIVLGPFADKADAEAAEADLKAALVKGIGWALRDINPPNDVPIEVESSIERGWDKP